VVTDPLTPPTFPHDGLVGFAGPDSSALNSSSWFQGLCSQGSLDCCRFGLAFETDDTGVQYFGEVEYDRFIGPLSVAPLAKTETAPEGELWELFGDIAANGKVVERDALIVTDSGTTVIFGYFNRSYWMNAYSANDFTDRLMQ
jgi:pepsin A